MIDSIRERHEELEAGQETGDEVRIAGRIRTIRTHGKVGFADLEDARGRLQLFAQQAVIGDEGMAGFGDLNVGDIVGAQGVVVRTRRGELSLKLDSVTVLAKCLRPMPEKFKGMRDVESRYRQRYLDLIVNEESRHIVHARATLNSTIRAFMEQRGFIEVETPLLQPIASGAVARPFVTHSNDLDMDLYLRVAPELYLKRLLIGGLEKVYELNRSFRNEGVSSRHNPEFVMLEAYEAYVDFETTMSLVEDLTRAVVQAVTGSLEVKAGDNTIDFEPPFKRMTMFEAIASATGEDLTEAWGAEDQTAIAAAARRLGARVEDAWGPGKVLLETYEQTAERSLIQPVFVVGYPKEVSPLVKEHRTIPGFTEQADLTINGVEIAPIYSELNDPEEQRKRFEQQAAAAAAGAAETAAFDEDFVEALSYGMPPAGGFGFGTERLLTTLLGLESMREVILFPILRSQA
jgi:lysyl-tRNA synthetase class 2